MTWQDPQDHDDIDQHPETLGPPDTPGANPLHSLTTCRCPALTRWATRRLLKLADLSLYLFLRIGGCGIPRVLEGRRGVSRVRRLGFERSARHLENLLMPYYPRPNRRRSGELPGQLALPIQNPSSSVPDVKSEGKSFTRTESQGRKGSTRQNEPGILPSLVGR